MANKPLIAAIGLAAPLYLYVWATQKLWGENSVHPLLALAYAVVSPLLFFIVVLLIDSENL